MQSELELLLRGQGEAWTPEFLLATIKCDHGYTSSSRSVRHFVEVLAELPQAEQRTLLRFVTGSPRLPPGGLAALRPPLTIVMKQSSLGAHRRLYACVTWATAPPPRAHRRRGEHSA